VADVVSIQGHKLAWLLDGLSLEQHEAHQHLSYASMI
jgi:hypothetical protein